MATVITGWGRGAWSEGPWGEAIPVVVTGVEATGEVGVVEVSIGATAAVAGVSATGRVGVAIAGLSITAEVTGVEAEAQTTAPTVWGPLIPDAGTTWTSIAA